jgi:hypothetical protein
MTYNGVIPEIIRIKIIDWQFFILKKLRLLFIEKNTLNRIGC